MAEQDWTAAIRDAYRASTADDIERGRAWYPAAERIIAGLADWSGIAPDRVAAIVAALSPRNPWNWNVQDAAMFAAAAARGDAEHPTATTFEQNRRRAWAFANGEADWVSAAPKVRSFVRNMTGDCDAVTVDVWAIRVATRGAQHAVRRSEYEAVAAAYRTVAAECGETPRDLQAITWVWASRTGLGSKRRGAGHAATLKAGTLAIVATLLAA